jgi:hypothetical protein
MKSLTKTMTMAGLFLLQISFTSLCYAQSDMQISGTIRNADTNAPIPYATIALLTLPDSSITAGTISDEAGNFSIDYIEGQNYLITTRCMGFSPISKQIGQSSIQEAFIFYLKPKAVAMKALVVKAKRKKAKSESNKTTYYVNSKMAEASHSGVDLLKQVPSVFIDLNQKITLQGSDKVLILVDGHERDVQFIRQLTAGQVNKVSLETPPGPQYDANLSGVLHIQTKKNRTGIRGHVHLELPTSADMVYLNPTYSLGYAGNRFNLYSSYTGVISQFDINEYRNQEQNASGSLQQFSFTEKVRQDNKNHRFNIGMDFTPNERNQFNILAFYNPYSNEHDGSAYFQSTNDNNQSSYWHGTRVDKDQNHRLFYSLFYKHNFNKHSQLQFDVSQFYFKGLNQTSYQTDSSSTSALTLPGTNLAPAQNSTFLKTDFKTKIEAQLHLSIGTKFTFINREDRELASYQFTENRQAFYTNLSWQTTKLHISGGARYEHYRLNSNETDKYNHHHFMPSLQVQCQFSSKSSLRSGYQTRIEHPNSYQLNPSVRKPDPYTLYQGNAMLKPAINKVLYLEYAASLKKQYMSVKIFMAHTNNAIGRYTQLNDEGILATKALNIGTTRHLGVQFSGALQLTRFLQFTPYVKIFQWQGTNQITQELTQSTTEEAWAIQLNGALVASLPRAYSLSASVQYQTPNPQFQDEYYSDALYFVSLNKKLNKKWQVGITSGLIMRNQFTYQGTRTSGEGFSQHQHGEVQVPGGSFWIKCSYRFSSGRKLNRIKRKTEKVEKINKKGF